MSKDIFRKIIKFLYECIVFGQKISLVGAVLVFIIFLLSNFGEKEEPVGLNQAIYGSVGSLLVFSILKFWFNQILKRFN